VHESSTPSPAVTPGELPLIPDKSETRGLVTFSTGGLRFGIPLESSDRALRMVAMSPLPGAPPFVIGTVNVHGELVAVADVCRRLGLSAPTYGPETHLLLARTSRRRVALAAEEVQGVIHVSRADTVSGANLAPFTRPVSGAVARPEGIVFIGDLEAFLSADEESELDRALGLLGP
jgi:purine-binding chemotaxis protein CheW